MEISHQEFDVQPGAVHPAESNAYAALEHELGIIAAGPPAAATFNFAVALIAIGISFALMLATTTIISDLVFIVYSNACMICLLTGIILLAFWLQARSVNITVAKIKQRSIVVTPVQEPPRANPATGP